MLLNFRDTQIYPRDTNQIYFILFQLVVHIVDADDAPPVVRGLAVIDDGGFVTMGEGGNAEKNNLSDYELTLLILA